MPHNFDTNTNRQATMWGGIKLDKMTTKDKKIIKDAKKNGTPIFVLTAKDKVSTETIADYLQNCMHEGYDAEHITGVSKKLTEFLRYQETGDVKLPD